MAIIGIDLGTTNSLVTVFQGKHSVIIPGEDGESLTPSAVCLEESGEVIVGAKAKQQSALRPEACAMSFKRFMGTKKEFKLGEQSYKPEELSAFVLRKLKTDAERFLGEEVKEAVISVPAYFNDAQRRATKLAGELAGLKVERLVNEPSAAALAYHIEGKREDRDYLVFDFGGGTLDVSVLETFENVIEIHAVAGDNQLGGDDFDQLIAEYFLRETRVDPLTMDTRDLVRLIRAAEQCKQALTTEGVFEMAVELVGQRYAATLTSQDLIRIGAPLFTRMEDVVRRALVDSGKTMETLDEIILVGGSSKMPVVKSYIKRLSGKDPLCDFNPDEIVAVGAGMQAGMKERNGYLREILLSDVCPFSLGIEIKGDRFSPIIERNSILPVSRVEQYVTTYDAQEKIETTIYQGERRTASENYKLGELEMDVPAAPAGDVSVNIRFTYDINGILEVDVSSKFTNQRIHKLILSDGNKMSDDEVAVVLKKLAHLKVNPRDKKENRQLLSAGEKLFESLTGDERQYIGKLMGYFDEALDRQDERMIAERRTQLTLEFLRLANPGETIYWQDTEGNIYVQQ